MNTFLDSNKNVSSGMRFGFKIFLDFLLQNFEK